MGRCVDVYLNKKQTCERHANKERRKNDCRNKERLLDASPRAIYLAVSAKRGAKPSAFLLQQNCDNKQYRNDDLKPEEKIPHYSPILSWAHTKVNGIMCTNDLVHNAVARGGGVMVALKQARIFIGNIIH